MESRKKAVVTGGTSGIGLSIAHALVAADVDVIVVGRNPEKGSRAEAELRARGPGHAHFAQVDLSEMASVRRFAAELTLDRLDLLAHIAGVLRPTRELTPEGFEITFAVDYLSAFVLSRALRPLLAKAPHGRILHVSGPAGQMFEPRLDFEDLQLEHRYGTVRSVQNGLHAKTVLAQALAERFAPDGIDVLAFDPGAVRSDLGRTMTQPMRFLFGLAQRFMPTESKAGIHAALSEDLNGVTGHFIEKTSHRPLPFDPAYCNRLWRATEALLDEVPGTSAAMPMPAGANPVSPTSG